MKFYILVQLLLFVLVALLTISLFKKRAGLLAVLFGGLFALQVASLYLGSSLIDYRFYVHFNYNDLRTVWDYFLSHLIVLALVFLFLSLGIYLLHRLFSRHVRLSRTLTLSLILVSLLLMSFRGGALRNAGDILQLALAGERDLPTALAELSVDPAAYTFPEEIEAEAGKNIVVICMESFEKAFLSDRLAHLTPNLRRLAKENALFNMPEGPGSNWTAGSLYTMVTGFPSFFKGSPNYIFQQTNEVNITGLSHVLKKAGYQLNYLLALKEYAGVGDMLKAYGFDVRSEKDFDETYESPRWGMHDKDLFHEAEKQIMAYDHSRPFALFLSTMATHPDDGVYDPRMEELIPKQKSNLEFMAAATDYQVNRLIGWLEEKGLLANTVFYLLPDHLMMGLAPRVMQDFETSRSLFVLTNADTSLLRYRTNEDLYQVDLPRLILDGAGVKHNARFLADFIPGDKLPFIEANKEKILAVNEASLETANYTSGIHLRRTENDSLHIFSETAGMKVALQTGERTTYSFFFDEGNKIIAAERMSDYEAFARSHPHLQLIVRSEHGKLYAYLRKGERLGIARQHDQEIVYSAADLSVFDDWTFDDPAFRPGDEPDFRSPFDLIYLTSTATGTLQLQHPVSIQVGSQAYPVGKGLQLFHRNGAVFELHTFNVTDSLSAAAFIRQLEKCLDNREYFMILAHDYENGFTKDQLGKLSQLGFLELQRINNNEAYIAYSYEGFITEYRNMQTLSVLLPQQPEIRRPKNEIHRNARETDRFIAHAGGLIEGYTYTNCLEALDLSYKKGFRLFELDILKTSDGKYVAAHDWSGWAEKAGYHGVLPVTAEEFMKHSICGKFTPLDMAAINDWFAAHKDAILISDKVNEPVDFSGQFIDKKRLKMELFSIEAVKEGLNIGLTVMPSMHVINAMEGNKLAQLKALGIKEITFSRYNLEANRDFLEAAKKNGIRTYVYNVNYEFGKDEAYVLCNELELAYGMYADKWDFRER